MATTRERRDETSGNGLTLANGGRDVMYRVFGTPTGVVVQRSERPEGATRTDYFVRFDRPQTLAACAELEAKHLDEPGLSGWLVRSCEPFLADRERVAGRDGAAPNNLDYAGRVLHIVQRIQQASAPADVLELMHLAIDAIGADAGAYLSVNPDPNGDASVVCLLACDVSACYGPAQGRCSLEETWLTYARAQAEPITIAHEPGTTDGLASTPQFSRTLLVPTTAASGSMRFGVMALGSATEGVFELEQAGLAQLLGRSLAAEVNGWLVRPRLP